MNERIRELDAQAVEYAVGVCDANGLYQGKEYLQVVKEKFAELIVGECADTVLGFHNQFGDSAHNEIREHFGVES